MFRSQMHVIGDLHSNHCAKQTLTIIFEELIENQRWIKIRLLNHKGLQPIVTHPLFCSVFIQLSCYVIVGKTCLNDTTIS